MKRDNITAFIIGMAMVLLGYSLYHLVADFGDSTGEASHITRYMPTGGLAVILIVIAARRRRIRNK